MSQRDVTQHFPALADEANDLEETILEFFEEHIQHKFPDPDCKQSALVLRCDGQKAVLQSVMYLAFILCLMDKCCVCSNFASSIVVLASHHFGMCVLCMSSKRLFTSIARGSKSACC